MVRVVAAPFAATGAVGRMARENSLRNPRRTATTASALMIGLALMAGLSVIAASMRASVSDLVERQLTADFVLNGGGAAQFPPQVSQAVEQLPGVASVATIGAVQGQFPGSVFRLAGLTMITVTGVIYAVVLAGTWDPTGWTRWLAWTLVVSGWVLATALIAGAARVLRPATAS